MKTFRFIPFIILIWAFPTYAKPRPHNWTNLTSSDYVKSLKKITDVMVEDVTGPCAAARYYAYTTLASWQVNALCTQNVSANRVLSQLSQYPQLTDLKVGKSVVTDFTSIYTLLRMGEELLPSGYLLEKSRVELEKRAQSQISAQAFLESKALADSVVKRFLRYALKDGYVKTSGYLRYTPINKSGYWQPTPPAYTEAYEPHWRTLRPFVLDSAAQFKPISPVTYSADPKSEFYALTKEVYDATQKLTKDQLHIANFWDCNPFFLNQKGHISFGTKKISPGGHWMGITGIACSQKKLDFNNTIRTHALVAMTMADAFISCWDEKYRSNRIRPETVINQWIDPAWRAVLQTPPFPEYTSGHSVVSASVATVLTAIIGENFAYTDVVEVEFGVPARKFKSFKHAAQEAAISRLYGGIHFRDSIEYGGKQGENIGEYILRKLALK
jgi:hypothetical protein